MLGELRFRFLARQFARPEGLFARILLGNWLDRISYRMNRFVIEQLLTRLDGTLLEVGFGGGDLLEALLAGEPRKVIGVDISKAMVSMADRRFRKARRDGRIELHRASVEHMPLADGSVDTAISVNSIYFWPDPEAAFAELARVVRPGGVLAICFEPPEELRKWPGHRFGFRLFELEEVSGLMEASGFGPVRVAWGTGRKPDRFCCLSGTRLGANG